MRVQATTVAVLLTVLPGSLTHVQQLVPGALIRGTSTDQRFEGRLAWTTPDSLAVVQDMDTTFHARSGLQALEIAAGARRHPWTGTAIGAGIGAVAGLAIIIAADDNRDSELEGLEVGVAAALTLGGAAVGAVAGALIKTRRWIRIHPAEVAVSIAF
jgi:hypothetical protein